MYFTIHLTSYYQYEICNQTYSWVSSLLTTRKQQVIMNDITSRWVSVKSGVPQGTVLGPLMFLIYINDICENVLSMLKLFADDCILYKAISFVEDCNKLQNDLNTLIQSINGLKSSK